MKNKNVSPISQFPRRSSLGLTLMFAALQLDQKRAWQPHLEFVRLFGRGQKNMAVRRLNCNRG